MFVTSVYYMFRTVEVFFFTHSKVLYHAFKSNLRYLNNLEEGFKSILKYDLIWYNTFNYLYRMLIYIYIFLINVFHSSLSLKMFDINLRYLKKETSRKLVEYIYLVHYGLIYILSLA